MPFTPAHVAAVLPVVGRRARYVVPAAWVVGSMSPDLVYFTPIGWVRPLSHSLTGLLTLDPAIGLAVLVAWWGLVAPAFRDVLPRPWRARVPVWGPPSPDRWPWVVVGLFAGSLTHVAWDAFTHHDGWVVRRVPALDEPLLGAQPAYSVLQDASGVVGMAVLVVWAWVVLQRAAPVHDATAVLSARERALVRVTAVALPVLLCTGLTALEVPSHAHLVNALFLGFTRAVGLTAVAAVVASGGWRRLRRRRAVRSAVSV